MAAQDHHTLSIVERQIRLWQLQRTQQESAPEPVRQWPLITVSREFGALGSTLAEAIAQRTGFATWDRKLVDAIANETGANTQMMASLDEKHRNAVEDAIQASLLGTAYTKSDYIAALLGIIHTIAKHGSSVVVGRGAYFVLEPEATLRVRVVSPLEVRTRWHMEQTGLTEREARKEVEKTEKERRDHIRNLFKRDITNPTNFDLVVNSASLPIDCIVDLVLHAYESKFGRRL